jgi:hypothetical protein
VHLRKFADVAHTFDSLRYELIRHHFWHAEIDERAINHALRKGRIELRKAVAKRLQKSISLALPSYDGRQTPMSGNVIFYAQHATASCCRKCLEYWHGIPQGRELNPDELAYLEELVWLYICERMPDLPEERNRRRYPIQAGNNEWN